MRKFHIVCLAFILVSTLISAAALFGRQDPYRDSYEKYLSGDCYFLAGARTTEPTDPNLIYNTNLDLSDPRNMLLLQTNAHVYAYDINGPYCTVIYDGTTITNFPVNRLIFETTEDYSLISGGKPLTYEEYRARIEAVENNELSDQVLSDKSMIPKKVDHTFVWAQIIFNVVVAAGMFFVKDGLDKMVIDIVLVFWTLVNIFLNIVIFNMAILS
ncbi:MAG: hypothetical protein J6127_00185 [Clostridiales bacterium]|nr:hypothetical protein [Clostridiales bacterium]